MLLLVGGLCVVASVGAFFSLYLNSEVSALLSVLIVVGLLVVHPDCSAMPNFCSSRSGFWRFFSPSATGVSRVESINRRFGCRVRRTGTTSGST